MRTRVLRQRATSPPMLQWRTVRLLIGFDGSRYEGWQDQKKGKTVQEIFEKFLLKILKEPVHLVSSSRTDSGVHALGLVAHLKTLNPLSNQKIKDALNFYLPRDIVVNSARTVDPDFHARYWAKSKIYRYLIWNKPTRPLFEAPYVLWHPHRLDVTAMRRAARALIGKHDFRAFMDGKDEKKTLEMTGRSMAPTDVSRPKGRGLVRSVKSLSMRKNKGVIQIRIEADGFLRHMVRVIVGTLIEVGRGKMHPEGILKILKSKDRKNAGPTAKSCGLTLVKVRY